MQPLDVQGKDEKRKMKRAKKARAAAEAAAEQGDGGLAHPLNAPEVRLEGRKALGGGRREEQI